MIVLLFETEEIPQELQANVYEETRSDGSTALMLSLLPDTSSFDIDSFNTEFIFLVDRSGSMRGDKILQTSLALEEVLNNLPAGSLFNFVSFGTNFEYAFKAGLPIDESSSLGQGLIFARSLSSTFGTANLINAITDILSSSPATGFQRVVIMLTDGGVINTDQVVSHVGNNRGSTRVFSLSIGEAGRELVNGIARAGGGTAKFVDSKELSLISEVASRPTSILYGAIRWMESRHRLAKTLSLQTEDPYFITSPTPLLTLLTLQHQWEARRTMSVKCSAACSSMRQH